MKHDVKFDANQKIVQVNNLKVGDKVKIIGNEYCGSYAVGETVQIRSFEYFNQDDFPSVHVSGVNLFCSLRQVYHLNDLESIETKKDNFIQKWGVVVKEDNNRILTFHNTRNQARKQRKNMNYPAEWKVVKLKIEIQKA